MNALLLAGISFFAAAADLDRRGAALSLRDATKLSDALSKPESFSGRDILLEGRVVKACRKKGCWMVLTDGERELRVTFKDYGFFVPKDIAGRFVRVQGRVERKTLSVKDARHYLKDEGATGAEIAKISSPVDTVAFVAAGVELLPRRLAP